MKISSFGQRSPRPSQRHYWLNRTGVLVVCLGLWVNSVWAALSPDIANGSMTGPPAEDSVPSGWVKVNSTPDVVGPTGLFNNTGVDWTASPDGGTFARLNGTIDPFYREEIEQTVGGFEPGVSYSMNFFVTNLGFIPLRSTDWRKAPGYIELFVDGALVGQTEPINAPNEYQNPIVWSPVSISFIATASTHTLKFSPRSLDPGVTVTSYMGIDGVGFGAEICANSVDDDGDGLVDGDDEDCQDPPAGDEVCNNEIDDDGDGLIDAEDPDCDVIDGFQDIKVRCIHEPLYPQAGESVTLRASTINGEGEEINVEAVEIYQENIFEENVTPPVAVAQGLSEVTYTFTPTGPRFAYGCRAVNEWEIATSWRVTEDVLRTVDVGELERPDIEAVPVAISGYRDQRIDVVFFADDDEYPSAADPAFQADVYNLIYEGFFTIPWFVEHQWLFNFWIGTAETANSGPNPGDVDENGRMKCFKTKPENYDEDYSWADVAALVHTSDCRDGAKEGAFSIEMEAGKLQVVAHEAGHTPFGLSDEYPSKPTGYFQARKLPNVFATEQACRDQAVDRTYEADDCRLLATDEDKEDWWLPEPNYRSESDLILRTKDLMQQTGAASAPDGKRLARYRVGNSEKDRMGWFWTRCVGGDC